MLCDLRVTLEQPDDVSAWIREEATVELVTVTARESGRTGVLGMTDGTETCYLWVTKTGKPVTKRWMERRWSGQKMTLHTHCVEIDEGDVVWDDDEGDA